MLNHKLKMDGVRSVLTDMEAHEVRLDRIREGAAARRWGVTTAFLIAGTLLSSWSWPRWRPSGASPRRAGAAARTTAPLAGGVRGHRRRHHAAGSNRQVIFANASAAPIFGFASPAALLSASPREIMDRFELLDEAGHPYPPDKLPARAVLTGAPRPRRSSVTGRARRSRGAGRR